MNETPEFNGNDKPQAALEIDNTASYAKRFMAFVIDLILIGLSFTVLIQYLDIAADPAQAQAIDMQTAFKLMVEKVAALSKEKQILIVVFPYIMFFIFHGLLLAQHGQTIGKRLMGLVIVTEDNQKLPFHKLILNRYLTQWIVGMIPGIGIFLRLVDILAIFGNNKRCLHDLIAKTKVIDLKIQTAKVINSIMA